MDAPDVIEQLPTSGPPVSAPTSGTYGDGAELDRLKGSLNLPGSDTGTPPTAPTPAPPGMPTGPAPSGVQAPGMLPDILSGPTSMPDTPVSTPLAGNPAPTAQVANAAQRRLRALDLLANDPNVSEETREWAEVVLQKLAGRGR